MKQTFTLAELHSHRGCYSKEMINYCVRGERTVSLDFILNHNEVKLTEKVWFISNNIELTPAEHNAIALGCAAIAVDMFGSDTKSNNPVVTGLLRTTLTNDVSIDNCMFIAGSKNQQYAYAIYAACSRDPYDRLYSAARSIELAGGEWVERLIQYWIETLVS